MSNAAPLQIIPAKPQPVSNVTNSGLLLQRKCACGTSTTSGGGDCEECKGDKKIQTKMAVGSSADPLEREADRVADQVMAETGPSEIKSAPLNIQRQATQTCGDVSNVPPSVDSVLANSGNPLDGSLRKDMEQRFGHDFSRVRVHSGTAAEQSARDVDAQAYTVGNNIVFGGGQYSSTTKEGRRLIAHELTHVVQQSKSTDSTQTVQRKGRGPGSCGFLSVATATILGRDAHMQIQGRLASRGFAVEMPIPRATKSAGVGSRKCQPLGTSPGYADISKINRPNVGISEIKPYWIAGSIGRLEAMHYRFRAEQSKQRITGVGSCGKKGAGTDDTGFNAVVGPLSAASSFTLLKGAISGTEDFGPFSYDKYKNLLAKEVTAGGIGYWCKINEDGKKKKEEDKEKKKKEKEEKKRKKKEERERKRKEKQEKRAKKKADKGKPKTEAPKDVPKKKPTDVPDKPKGKPKKPVEPPKPKPSAGAANVGFGISIFSSSVGAANASVGISVGSDSAAFGTAGAGISWFSDSAAAATASLGVAEDSESLSVAGLGAGENKGSSTAGALTAGKGEVEDSLSASAATGSSGELKGSTTASAGGLGSGKQEGVTGAGTGSPKKPGDPQVDPKDVTGPDAEKTPEGQGDAEMAPGKAGSAGDGQTGEQAGDTPAPKGDAEAGGSPGQEGQKDPKGDGSGQDTQTGDKKDATGTSGDSPGDKGAGGDGDKPGATGTPGAGTGTGTGDDASKPGATGTAQSGAGTGKVDLGVLPVFPWGASDADRDKIGAEAAKVAVMLEKASDAQKLFLQHLANKEQSGQYLIPASDWMDKLLKVTESLTAEEIEYIKNLDWKPGSISEEEMRKRIQKALENRNKPPATGEGDKSGGAKKKDESGGGEGKGKGKGQGAGEGDQAGKKKGAGDKGAGETGDTPTPTPGDKPPAERAEEGKPTTAAPTAGVPDVATAPPAGSDRSTAGLFGFNVVSGLTASSSPAKGEVIPCDLSIDDKGKKFPLKNVSITFDSRVETRTVDANGIETLEITLNFYFTDDFYSKKNTFYGRGGPESLTNIKFFQKSKKK